MDELLVYAFKMLGMALPLVLFMAVALRWSVKKMEAAEERERRAKEREIALLQGQVDFFKQLEAGKNHADE